MPSDSAPADRLPPEASLWDLGDAWLRRAAEVIGASEEALDALNVFPVSDADTGSNLRLTLTGVAQSVQRFERASLNQLVQAAILSAHGNSGAIVAEMFISVCRAIERRPLQLARTPPGEMVAVLLQTVAEAATQAVAEPVFGTILTVADEAARTAREAAARRPDDALAVAQAAQRGAHEALARTPQQLAVLGEAGVVDAGGQALVLMLDVLVEVLGGPPAVPLTQIARPHAEHADSSADDEYEVMYVLTGAEPDRLTALRDDLSRWGTSVVVVGDAAAAHVHVHLREAGRAIEAALEVGRLSRITVQRLPGPAGYSAAVAATGDGQVERTVLFVAAGPGLAQAVRALGGQPIEPGDGSAWDELHRAASEARGDLVLLPNDMERLEVANHLAADLRREGRRVAVIPTIAQVQGLAAMAVHEPAADFEAVVVAMSTAAGHARHGAVTVAESPAMTMAGRCSPGDVLGVVEGDFVEIGGSPVEVGTRVIDRLLALGGELLTLVAGREAPAGLTAALAAYARRGHRELDVEIVDGGQSRYLVLVGVE